MDNNPSTNNNANGANNDSQLIADSNALSALHQECRDLFNQLENNQAQKNAEPHNEQQEIYTQNQGDAYQWMNYQADKNQDRHDIVDNSPAENDPSFFIKDISEKDILQEEDVNSPSSNLEQKPAVLEPQPKSSIRDPVKKQAANGDKKGCAPGCSIF